MSDKLTKGWESVKLGEITSKVGSGATPRGGSESYEANGVPLIRSMNVRFEGFTPEGLAFLNKSQAEALDAATVNSGDVLLNITGASIGRATQAPASMNGARVNQHVCIVRPKPELDATFLARFLASPSVQRMIWTEQYGVTRQALTKGQILEFDIPLPSLGEQRRIVAKLETLLGKVDACHQRLTKNPVLLKRFRQSVLAAACSGRLTADWRDKYLSATHTATNFLRELQTTRNTAESCTPKARPNVLERRDERLTGLTDIPESWMWCSASECSDVRDGTHDSPAYHPTGVPLITSKNLVPGGVDFSNVKFISRTDYREIARRSAVADNDVLFAMIGTIGNATIVNGGHPFAIKNVGLFRTFGNTLLARFLSCWLNSPYAKSFFDYHNKGTSQPFAPLNLLRSLPVPLPPQTECEEIVRRVEELFALAAQIEARHAKAAAHVEKLTQSILAKAFRGELVPQDPNDEPASVLLERIRQLTHAKESSKRKTKRPALARV
jgi:type I restriction enzyme S subunit